MPDAPVSPQLLSDDDFQAGTAAWLQLVKQAGSQKDLLDTAFSTAASPSQDNRLLYFGMPTAWVQWLTSTVGCIQVKTRFLVNQKGQFALGLYATDEQEQRISAYYLLNAATTSLSEAAVAGAGETTAGNEAVQIPHGVAGAWLKAWQAAATLVPAMFTTTYGVLEGYNFSRDDWADNLFDVDPAQAQQLRVDFGLHQYYAPGASGDDAQPSYTFGLVLRLVNPEAQTSDAPFYDMSFPCPPGT